MSVLTVDGVTKRYGGVHALTGVDVNLPMDGRVGLIGPNGSGKTTLLAVLTGLTRATSGTIRCGDTDITTASIRRRVDLGLGRTFQHSNVFPGATVEENLRFAVDSRPRRTRADVDPTGLAEVVGISHLLASPASGLSWGECRLLGLALALALEPRTIFVDEPFAGLSPVAADQVIEVLRAIHAGGTGLCVIDHDMDYLSAVCDHVVVLVDGAVLTEGATADVLASDLVQDAYLGKRSARAS